MKLTRRQIRRLADSILIKDLLKYYNVRYIFDGSGGRYKAHCPFHQDRTPSMKIYSRTNSWYTFCCGKGGGTYRLIKEIEGDTERAFEVLIEQATIELPDDPLKDLQQELLEQERQNDEQEIEKWAYLIGLKGRDFLLDKRDQVDYLDWTERVDNWYRQLDQLLDYEDVEVAEIRQLHDCIEQVLQEEGEVDV